MLSGFFTYTSADAGVTDTIVANAAAAGADTLITFGTRLKRAAVRGNKPFREGFESCTDGTVGCLEPLYRTYDVKAVYTYDGKASWAPRALKCAGEKTLTSGGQRFTLLVLPHSGSCRGAVDVVVSRDAPTGPGGDLLLLNAARKHSVKIFLGLPAPTASTSQAWLPDMTYPKALDRFTRRYLDNLRLSAGSSALEGFYHHTEMPLRSSASWEPVRELYAMQNRAVADTHPGKKALISPFIDARRASSARTPISDVAAATRLLARTASGIPLIIAPQDGQGTGKVGAFDASTKNHRVDAPSRRAAGEGTYAQVYEAGTGDYMREVVKGAGSASIWVNLELMTATTDGAPECQGAPLGRGRASIARVREQHRVAAVPGVSKTIGFMWQPYVTCGGSNSLQSALAAR